MPAGVAEDGKQSVKRKPCPAPLVGPGELSEDLIMPSETHNTQAGEEQRGSSGDNIRRQQQESRDPDKSNARDRENRKGGDSASNL
jgi:hypothetical protein